MGDAYTTAQYALFWGNTCYLLQVYIAVLKKVILITVSKGHYYVKEKHKQAFVENSDENCPFVRKPIPFFQPTAL